MVAVGVKRDLKAMRPKALECFLYFRAHVIGRQFLEGNEFQEEMAEFFQHRGEKQVKVVRVPRGHGKTTALIDYIIWRLCRDRNERVLISGPTRDHAKAVLGAIKEIVLKTRLLRDLFSDVWPKDPANACELWTRNEIQIPRDVINKNPTIQTCGVDSGTTGSHYTLICPDDQVNDNNYKSKVMRDGVWTHTLNLHALLDDTPGHRAEMVYTNTPWHPMDATMRLTSPECSFKEDIECFERVVYRSGTLDTSQGVIWEEVRDEAFVAKQRAKGMRFFSPHFMMAPLAEGQHPFDVEKLQRFELDYRVAEDGTATWAHPMRRDFYIHMAVDTNTNADTAADPAAIMVWAKDHARHMWALDKRILKGPTTTQLLEAMHMMFVRWKALTIHIEVRGKEDRFLFEIRQFAIRKGVSYPVNALTRGGRTGRASKYSRITPMSAAVNEGWFHVPTDPTWQDFVEEMEVYDENCEHDDMMDCAADVYTHGRWPLEPEPEKEKEVPSSAQLLRVFSEPKISDGSSRLVVHRNARIMV